MPFYGCILSQEPRNDKSEKKYASHFPDLLNCPEIWDILTKEDIYSFLHGVGYEADRGPVGGAAGIDRAPFLCCDGGEQLHRRGHLSQREERVSAKRQPGHPGLFGQHQRPGPDGRGPGGHGDYRVRRAHDPEPGGLPHPGTHRRHDRGHFRHPKPAFACLRHRGPAGGRADGGPGPGPGYQGRV